MNKQKITNSIVFVLLKRLDFQGDNEQTIQILEETTTVNRSKVKAASDDDTEANSVNYYFIIGMDSLYKKPPKLN